MTIQTNLNDRQPSKVQATVLDLFRQQVCDTPERLAVVFEDRELTYRQLDRLANQFANAMLQRNVAKGESVGLSFERTPEAIACMLGAFKIGAVFVPLDPEYPAERIRLMIEDAGIRVVLTNDCSINPVFAALTSKEATQTATQAMAPELFWIDSGCIEFAELDNCFNQVPLGPDDLAYIMYTSGSTGKPKGVQIEHRALTTYCLADIEVYRLTSSDRTLQFSTLNFDIAIEEIFPPLLIGSCVVVRPRERSSKSNELSKLIQDFRITAIHLATAYWHEWVDLMQASAARVPSCLRLVIATGEKVSVAHYRRWQTLCDQRVLWCNAYGPTETTVTATVFIPDEDFCTDPMPIGKPLPGYAAHILSAQDQPVGVGETGLLYIAGPALARGYLNRPEQNEASFRTVDVDGGQKLRLYRTGDLARWLPDGNIEFAGRVDHQIKLGSYRIEPGEIEAELNRLPGVLESLVLVEQFDQQKHLIAYVATQTQQLGEAEAMVDSISSRLAAALPAYMVPRRFVLLERLPKTLNGKIDRAALPTPDNAFVARTGPLVAPETEIEKRLAEIWQDVLQVPEVGRHDDFFTLGGSSLLVTRVIAELTTQLVIELPVRDFFANPTLASSARHIENCLGLGCTAGADFIGSGSRKQDNSISRNRLPLVHANYLTSGDRQLFCVRYQPRQDSGWPAVKQHGVLLCHPLGHEYSRSYRNLQQLAVQLCQQGFDVLRFDYFGTGNSSGGCDEVRAESLRGDVRRAAKALRKHSGCEKLSVVGLRLGATIAATAGLTEVDQVLLWDPVVDAHHFVETLDRFTRFALTSQTRFSYGVVHSSIDQAYGHAMSDEKRCSLSKLRLEPNQISLPSDKSGAPVGAATRSLILLSESYRESEPGIERLCAALPNEQTGDQIYWHAADYTESAFASPHAFTAIQRFLSGVER